MKQKQKEGVRSHRDFPHQVYDFQGRKSQVYVYTKKTAKRRRQSRKSSKSATKEATRLKEGKHQDIRYSPRHFCKAQECIGKKVKLTPMKVVQNEVRPIALVSPTFKKENQKYKRQKQQKPLPWIIRVKMRNNIVGIVKAISIQS